jgi:ligand-binding sensor domain-containing protein
VRSPSRSDPSLSIFSNDFAETFVPDSKKFCLFANILYFERFMSDSQILQPASLHPSLNRSVILRAALLSLAVSLLGVFGGCTSPSDPPPVLPKAKWQVFKASASLLADNHVNAIFMDNARRVWFATNNGASYFDNGAWATIRDSLTSPDGHGGPPNHRVTCIVQAKDRSMWFGLTGGGVQRYNPISTIAVWTRYTVQSTFGGLVSDLVLSGTADISNQSAYGEVWFTSAIGISRFVGAANETGTWHFYTHDNTGQIPSNQVWSSMTKLDDNTLWFGTQTGGAVSVEYGLAGLNWTQYSLPVDSRINSMAFDLQNTVWFGNENGAASFNVQTSDWRVIDSAGVRLRHGPVNSVTTNHQNIRWFGTDAGAARLADTTWTIFTAANSPLPSDTVNAVAFDFNQNIWIGTDNGVAVYNESGLTF